jgi:SAV_6107-like HEPN
MATQPPDSTGAAFALLRNAHVVLDRARDTDDPGERFCLAHLSALRTAAVVLALRGRPSTTRRRLVPVWLLLDKVAPEYADWSAYFAAGAPIRAAVEAGASSVLTQRVADDQLRSAGEFLAIVEGSVGMLAA